MAIEPEGFSSVGFMITDENGWENMRRWMVGHRKRAHLTQAQVAERMDVSQSQVSDFERGKTDPHVSTVSRYMLAIGLGHSFRLSTQRWGRDE